MSNIWQMDGQAAAGYATAANLMEIYNEEIRSLHLLSLLLTADPEKADKCLMDSLEECLHGMDVFLERALLLARRAIIEKAIMAVRFTKDRLKCPSPATAHRHSKWANDNFIGAIFALGNFERLVFVMSLLERQSDDDCCELLACKQYDIESARSKALRKLSDNKIVCKPFKEALQAWKMIRTLRGAGPVI
jgi:DNA-directed RNA polymerase specialized sigma24 family protein